MGLNGMRAARVRVNTFALLTYAAPVWPDAEMRKLLALDLKSFSLLNERLTSLSFIS